MTYFQLAIALKKAHRFAGPSIPSTLWPQMSKAQAWALFSRAVSDFLPAGANIQAPDTIVNNFREEFPEVKMPKT